jgi:NhaA family Na+:H+ antiporter
MLGVASLAGIGFTMSLFIGTLSFTSVTYMNEVRLGVLGGSLISAIFGYAILRFAPSPAVGTAEDVQTPMVHPTGH